jgi:tetratricopeptide (TPR) repeat protein
VKRLTDRARASVTNLTNPARDARLMLVAETLEDLGQTPEATAVVERLAEISPTAPTLERLGDLYAKAEQWPRAAAAYDRAWERDHARPLPLLLRGWMLVKSGDEKQGRALIETAHALPLSDETDRHSLMTALSRRGLADEARRERDLILRTAEPGSWERGDALRRAAEEAHAKGDDLVAADLWERAFLNNLNTRISFVESQANLMIPVLIHRARAQGYARAGRTADAVAEAKTCLDHCPGDADAQIAIVNTLAKSNHPAETDTVYARARNLYAKLAATYPESAPAHNLIAWLESRCRRDLDDAVAHGQKAVDLEPDNTAVLDTLAEAHLQRGDIAKARELVKRCLKLEPTSEHHRKNLARIEAAVPGKPVPDLDAAD